eukprot:GFYU01007474.1.p1 GENE.GFYU01007474.1~~GFYU01007474.1.p1  ORF type:complete len:357 (-),score=110.02 GFYU01007474.1:1149-2141(-)
MWSRPVTHYQRTGIVGLGVVGYEKRWQTANKWKRVLTKEEMDVTLENYDIGMERLPKWDYDKDQKPLFHTSYAWGMLSIDKLKENLDAGKGFLKTMTFSTSIESNGLARYLTMQKAEDYNIMFLLKTVDFGYDLNVVNPSQNEIVFPANTTIHIKNLVIYDFSLIGNDAALEADAYTPTKAKGVFAVVHGNMNADDDDQSWIPNNPYAPTVFYKCESYCAEIRSRFDDPNSAYPKKKDICGDAEDHCTNLHDYMFGAQGHAQVGIAKNKYLFGAIKTTKSVKAVTKLCRKKANVKASFDRTCLGYCKARRNELIYTMTVYDSSDPMTGDN